MNRSLKLFWKGRSNDKKNNMNKNKTSSDDGSVPDLVKRKPMKINAVIISCKENTEDSMHDVSIKQFNTV